MNDIKTLGIIWLITMTIYVPTMLVWFSFAKEWINNPTASMGQLTLVWLSWLGLTLLVVWPTLTIYNKFFKC